MNLASNLHLQHIVNLTDNVGIFQHATFDIPNRSYGYCIDDIGRALIVSCAASHIVDIKSEGERLTNIYLAYLLDAQLENGAFHNFMSYDRRWQDDIGTPDSIGRAIWGLGYASAHASKENWKNLSYEIIKKFFNYSDNITHLRSLSYIALGIIHVLSQRKEEEFLLRSKLDKALNTIYQKYLLYSSDNWKWCEDIITYDNGRLCEVLILGGRILNNSNYINTGLAMLSFYASITFENEIFIPIGNNGWYPKDGSRAYYAQQPLEAASMVAACCAAYEVTHDSCWKKYALLAHSWYLGRNSKNIQVAQKFGCCDGINSDKLNENMGAESTICYFLSCISLSEYKIRNLRIAK